MPRKARLDAEGTLQHVIARGIERRPVFRDDDDRERFLERLGLLAERTHTPIYAFALIPHHFHLLLRSGPGGLCAVSWPAMRQYTTYGIAGPATSFGTATPRLSVKKTPTSWN